MRLLPPMQSLPSAAAAVFPSRYFWDEGGPVEIASIIFWMAAALVANRSRRESSDPRDRLQSFWFASTALLAALREGDAQFLLGKHCMGSWACHWRIDWLLASSSPVVPRILTVLLFAGIAALLLLPLLRLRLPWFRLLRSGDPIARCLALVALCLVLGYVTDDVLRPCFRAVAVTKRAVEETAELLGAVLFFRAVLAAWRTPIAARLARLRR